jgi:hypothetical protein
MVDKEQQLNTWATHYIPARKMALYFAIALACIAAGPYFLSYNKAREIIVGAALLLMGVTLCLKILRLILGGNIAFRFNADGIEIPVLVGT